MVHVERMIGIISIRFSACIRRNYFKLFHRVLIDASLDFHFAEIPIRGKIRPRICKGNTKLRRAAVSRHDAVKQVPSYQ